MGKCSSVLDPVWSALKLTVKLTGFPQRTVLFSSLRQRSLAPTHSPMTNSVMAAALALEMASSPTGGVRLSLAARPGVGHGRG